MIQIILIMLISFASHYSFAQSTKIFSWPAGKEAVASGHEIGNHSLYHPCSGNQYIGSEP